MASKERPWNLKPHIQVSRLDSSPILPYGRYFMRNAKLVVQVEGETPVAVEKSELWFTLF